jgi:hypothetical protein
MAFAVDRVALLACLALALACAGPDAVGESTNGSSEGSTDGSTTTALDTGSSTTAVDTGTTVAETDPDTTTDATGSSSTDDGTSTESTTGPDPDADDDGYLPPEECDDSDPDVYPGAPERCNGIDDDCDPVTVEDGVVSVDGQGSFASIGEAVAAAAPGSEVRVCAGTWPETVTIDQDLTLVAQEGAAVTIIDAGAAGPVVSVDAGEVGITGFTLTGGSSLGQGGGLSVFGEDPVTVDSCVITGNQSTDGAGIYTYGGAQLTLVQTTISDNIGGIGGGVAMNGDSLSSSLSMTGCTVSSNVVDEAGAGFVLVEVPDVQIDSTSIVDNVSLDGGGFTVSGSTITLTNSAVLRNTANGQGGGLLLYPGIGEVTSVDSNWGTGTDDNLPQDVSIPGIGAWSGYGMGASFVCDVTGCA